MNPNYTEFKFPQVGLAAGAAVCGACRAWRSGPFGSAPERAAASWSSRQGPLSSGRSRRWRLAWFASRQAAPWRIHPPNPLLCLQIKAHPWTKVFSKRMPQDAVDLVGGQGGPGVVCVGG